MSEVPFGKGRKALVFGKQRINLHEQGIEFEPKAKNPTPGSADLCFITAQPINQVLEHLLSSGVKIVEGPVERLGVRGAMASIYFRDPDGNLIEVSNYGGNVR